MYSGTIFLYRVFKNTNITKFTKIAHISISTAYMVNLMVLLDCWYLI